MTLTTHYIYHVHEHVSLPSSHTKFSPLFVIMEPMIFTYSFTINGYDVTVTIEFFSHIVVLEDSFPGLTDDKFKSVIYEIANS